MVSDKSKLDINVDVNHECGDNVKLSNLDESRTSSSDESSKSKSWSEVARTDGSAKDESEDEGRELNCTYTRGDAGDAGPAGIVGSVWRLDGASLKLRTPYSLSSNFDSASCWSGNLSDLKFDNITLEDTKLTDGGDNDSLLMKIRNYLAEYQELRGLSRGEYKFSELIKVIGQATGRCLLALFYVIVNIAPVLEIFLHILRFVFDAIIEIKNTTDAHQVIFKTSIFFVQMLSIYICLIFIFGFIVSPVVRMAFGIIAKIMLYD